MGTEGDENKRGSYNQAGSIQERLHELFTMIDRFSICLFDFDYNFMLHHYKIVYAGLNTIFSTTNSKLTEDERKELREKKVELRETIRKKSPFTTSNDILFSDEKSPIYHNRENQDIIEDCLFVYRTMIDDAMEKHDLLNPNKEQEGGWD